ncbi:hypothetical protein [Pseudarthrobacter sp. NPDC057230]|uniref:hypothetical protein n=1 Tax=Pseudarthrobacter sp. NPDC057230 TaxID=3346057 RepID=UPI003637BB88
MGVAILPTNSHFEVGAVPSEVSEEDGSPQMLLPPSLEALGLAVAALLEAGAGSALLGPLGSKKMKIPAATSATTSAAAMMKPGLVNGLLSVVLSVDWLIRNLPLMVLV